MISSMAYGGAVLQEEKYIRAAERAAKFIMDALHKNGRLMRYHRQGQAVELAFLDDYAFTIMGFLDLYEASFETKWLIDAKILAEEMIQLFADNEQGGFFLTGKDSEKLITRIKPSTDGVIPSGNSAAAFALLKLGKLTMNQHFTEQGIKVLESFSRQLKQSSGYSSEMLSALNFSLGPTQEIVIAGNSDATDTQQMLKLIRSKFLPNAVILLHQQENSDSGLDKTIPFVKNLTAIEGKATAYVCENFACNRPVNKLDDLEILLSNISRAQ
jgi:uncharacterized protein YyaL (SSP411 family)